MYVILAYLSICKIIETIDSINTIPKKLSQLSIDITILAYTKIS